MAHLIKISAAAFFTIIVLDYIFLGFIANKFYVENFSAIGRIENGKFQIVYWAAALVYLFLAVGISVFVLPRIDSDASYLSAFLFGALFGFLTYGTYDMTNYATIKDFSMQLALFDMTWGALVCGLGTLAAFAARQL